MQDWQFEFVHLHKTIINSTTPTLLYFKVTQLLKFFQFQKINKDNERGIQESVFNHDIEGKNHCWGHIHHVFGNVQLVSYLLQVVNMSCKI